MLCGTPSAAIRQPAQLAAGTALMASALAFQAWLSVAKPWGKVRSGVKLPTAPTWVFVAAVLAPLTDITVGLLLGYPLPALSLAVLIIQLVRHAAVLGQASMTPVA